MENKTIENINPYEDDWTTGDLAIMSDAQVLKCLHHTLNELNATIREAKKKMGIAIFLDDVSRKQISNSLMIEVQKRWLKEEIIPVEK